MDALKIIAADSVKEQAPQFSVGDTVRVSVNIREGDRERIQQFEGTVIARKGSGVAETFTVRRVSYGVTTVNYNRDVEIFPVLNSIFEGIYGESPYKSPTDMGVNMVGNCIVDDEACKEASCQEIIRRYYQALNRKAKEQGNPNEVYKIELLMKQAKISVDMRTTVQAANDLAAATGAPAAAMELPDGTIVTGKTSNLLGSSAALILNAVKALGNIGHEVHLIAPSAIEPIQKLKVNYLGSKNPRLHTDEVLIALSMCAATDPAAQNALNQLSKLKGCQVHTSVMLSDVDINIFKKLGVDQTSEPVYEERKIYH